MNTDYYAVVGHPVTHSKSPQIHASFAAQLMQPMHYGKIDIPPDEFEKQVRALIKTGYSGLNVTVPHKLNAYELADQLSERARRAGAVNTLSFKNGEIHGDNTDGIGMVRDIESNHATAMRGKDILILGAGGAVRGVLAPMLGTAPATITIANRTAAKAEQLASEFADLGETRGGGFDIASGPYDLIINGTAASLSGDIPPISDDCVGAHTVCYDMMYSNEPTPFQAWAREHGAAKSLDGLGMLVEQAAESFAIWRGLQPETAEVIRALR